MSAKVKMRCARCGKSFKSAGAKQTLCPDCEQKQRLARAATKADGPRPVDQAPAATPTQVKIIGPGASILVPGMTPPPSPTEPIHTGHSPTPASSSLHPAPDRAERHPKAEKAERHAPSHAPARQPKSAAQPKQPKQPKPATPAFVLTDELRASIERRYLELAQPVEFDGIRTRISEELNIPKAAVRRVVQEVRTSNQLPSWWELQAFTGTEQDLSRIRSVYEPLLPLPPVGVHKEIATSLGLEPLTVYQGIRRIRAELRLPQYNPPAAHTSQATGTEPPDIGHAAEPDASSSHPTTVSNNT